MADWFADVSLLDPYRRFEDGIDASANRQFDDQAGGGWFDLDTYVPGYSRSGSDASVPHDENLASTDEAADNTVTNTLGAIPRQFDDTPGGGVVDGVSDTTDKALNAVLPGWVPEWVDSDDVAVIGVVLVVAYVIGQLFTFEVGS